MQIAWQSRSKLVYNSIESKKLEEGANGGNIYDFQAALAISSQFLLKAFPNAVWQNDNLLSYHLKLKIQPEVDISILEPYPVVFGTFAKGQKYIAIVHHIDFDRIENSIKHKLFFKRQLNRLKKVDVIVTVSNYWKNFLEEKGCKNVQVIYNSFDSKNYQFEKNQLTAFKMKLGFDLNKPLIHIGKATAEKGVYDVYDALKNQGLQLIMSGGSNQAKDLPIKFFNLPDTEYRMLIASCDVVVAFSSMMEGWNRIAHEAMLCKVPVVGSGVGGMQELLEGGKQFIAKNKDELKLKVEEAIKMKDELGSYGYLFASKFDKEYFNQAWINIIRGFDKIQ